MPVATINDLPAAGALDGTEPLETVQGGVSKKTTTAEVANLAGRRVKYRDVANADAAILSTDDGIAVDEGAALQTLTLPAAPVDGEAHPLYPFLTGLGGTLKVDANGKTIFFQTAGAAGAAAFQTLAYTDWGPRASVVYFAARDIWMITA